MNKLNLIPTNVATQRMLVEVLAAMVKHYIATKQAAATSELLRPSVATTGTSLAQTGAQSDSTTLICPLREIDDRMFPQSSDELG